MSQLPTSSLSTILFEFIHNFAFLRTDGAGTSPPPCSKLLAQNVCSYPYTYSVFHGET